MYDDVRTDERARDLILEFFESAYRAGAKRAGWNVEELALKPFLKPHA
jgi:hypothetical protein